MRRDGSLLLALLLAPLTATAAGGGSTAAGSVAPVVGARPLPADSLLQVVLALGAVIALIFLLAWVLRRMQTGAGFSARGMRVVAMLPLSPRERLVLVQVGEQQVLLGVAPGRVSLLQNYEQPVVVPANAGGTDFAARLKQALRPGGDA